MFKSMLIAGTVAAACAAAPLAQARDYRDSNVDYARVVAVQPIVHRVRVAEPTRECRDVAVRRNTAAQAARDTVIGSIIGGVVGHQFGGGRGRSVATVAGAVVGAAMGSRYAGQRGGDYAPAQYERRCRTITAYRTERRVDGYRVTYRYHGRRYHARMPYDPGRRMRVDVWVNPIIR